MSERPGQCQHHKLGVGQSVREARSWGEPGPASERTGSQAPTRGRTQLAGQAMPPAATGPGTLVPALPPCWRPCEKIQTE
ncbi:hypothetical protein FKM82_025897 [Ascaphus truei]